MKDIAGHLAAIGFRRPRRAPQCWRVSRIDTPVPAANRAWREPAQSRILPRWLDRLADRLADPGQPPPYRITRAVPFRARA